MFDIGWSELVVIAVVALVAIGPKELPGVLRMVGQWVGKARKMASEFQGQFNEALREAEMSDLKQSFDDIKDAASGLNSKALLGLDAVEKDVKDALSVEDRPAEPEPTGAISLDPVAESSTAAASDEPLLLTPSEPAQPTPDTFVEAEAHSAASEPLAVVKEFEPQPAAVVESAPMDDVARVAAKAEADKTDKDARAS